MKMGPLLDVMSESDELQWPSQFPGEAQPGKLIYYLLWVHQSCSTPDKIFYLARILFSAGFAVGRP